MYIYFLGTLVLTVLKNPTTHTTSNKDKRYIGDFSEDNMITPENRKKIFKLTNSDLAAKKKNIKIFQQPKRRLQKRISDLKSFVTHLQSKNMISEEVSTTLTAQKKNLYPR